MLFNNLLSLALTLGHLLFQSELFQKNPTADGTVGRCIKTTLISDLRCLYATFIWTSIQPFLVLKHNDETTHAGRFLMSVDSERRALLVMLFEITELHSTDILDYVSENYLLSEELKMDFQDVHQKSDK